MKRKEICATGVINNNGALSMYMGELKQFFAMHASKKVIARFIVSNPGTSAALRGYYYNYVVPMFKSAFWENGERLTEKQTEQRLREYSPIMLEEWVNDAGKYEARLREINELSNAELIEHIETLKQLAAEEFYLFIDDPNTI